MSKHQKNICKCEYIDGFDMVEEIEPIKTFSVEKRPPPLKKYNHKKSILTGLEPEFNLLHRTVPKERLPVKFDLRTATKWVPAILDQGQLGSCGPTQISSAMKYCLSKQSEKVWQPSRLFMYYYTREFEGGQAAINEDTGISIKDCLDVVSSKGACNEILWPYYDDSIHFKIKPTDAANKDALLHANTLKYLIVKQNLNYIKKALYSKMSIVFGILIYESFESESVASTGIVPMPNTKTEELLGGHCVQIWGWDDTNKVFIVSNSWGTSWGQKGYFTLPYAYVLNKDLSSDFFALKNFK